MSLRLQFLDLPPELILQCLAHLPFTDLSSCLKCSSRRIRAIIMGSVLIKYRAEQEGAGVEENLILTSNSVILDCLRSLQSQESNWLDFTPTSRHVVSVDFEATGLYDLTSSIFLVGDTADPMTSLCTAIRYMHTPPAPDEPQWSRIDAGQCIIDFGTALEEHDLIAMVTDTPHANDPQMRSIDIKLLQFSTGRPHPLAMQPTLHIHHASMSVGRPGISIEVVDQTLAISLLYWGNELRNLDALYLYNWKSGILRLGPTRVYSTGLIFLSTEMLIVPNALEECLDVFRIPSDEAKAPHQIHSFLLPSLYDEDTTILSFQSRSEPNPRESINHPSRTKFAPRLSEAIILFTFEASHRVLESTEHLFVLDRGLFTGARLVSIAHDAWSTPAPIRIFDFNAARVEFQRKRGSGPIEGEHATVCVKDAIELPNWQTHLDTFREPVQSHLPYLEITSKELFDFDAVMINDESIIGAKFDQRFVESLEVLRFGADPPASGSNSP
ncbi:hypothetical protein B0H16DRAFT_1878445 [Mycena metata]|uniref:F-box domain-containing protein n=1 Tax=Mycena metata TaxID=1033252 RepID=A0AAD7K9D0_9AGAR|nr:hypothetical protein B0H16DRAFT_1878445 [Mycena metata]